MPVLPYLTVRLRPAGYGLRSRLTSIWAWPAPSTYSIRRMCVPPHALHPCAEPSA